MCLAFPAKIIQIEENMAKVECAGVKRNVSLMLLSEAKVGDYVLIHVGFAIQIIDEREAKIQEELMAEMCGAPRTVDKIFPEHIND